MSATIFHSLNLLIVVVAAVVGWLRISRLRSAQATYDARILPFAYYSFTAIVVWGLQCILQLARPLLLIPDDLFVDLGLLLGVIHNTLWLAAVVPLYSKRVWQMSQTVPIFIAVSTVIAAVTLRTGVLTSAGFAYFDVISGFLIFVAVAGAILNWRLSRLTAVVFVVYGYFEGIWRSLWLTPFYEMPVLSLVGFSLLRFALLFFWIKVISEMVQKPRPLDPKDVEKVQQELPDLLTPFYVMISSTIDLQQERDAAEQAIRGLYLVPLRSETFGSYGRPPREICRLLADKCNILVLITGERYGTKIEPENVSVVEFELNTAFKENPDKILLYVKDRVSRDDELVEFLKRLEAFNVGFYRSLFKTPEELYEQIQKDIARWLTSEKRRNRS
jgi:Domain of unknown function (DUF4062)